MKRTYINMLLIASVAPLLMASTQIVSDNEGDIWRNEFFNYERRVLPLEKSLVSGVRICAGLKEKDALLAAVMTSLHHDAIGKKSPQDRLQYDRLAFKEKELLQYATLFKGNSLTAAEESDVKKIFNEIRRDFGKRSSYWKVNGSFFAGMSLAMRRDVFGSTRDIRKMLDRLEQKNGWQVTFDEYTKPSDDVIIQALNQQRVPLLFPTGSGNGSVLVVLGAFKRDNATLLVSCDPVVVSVGKSSLFDQVPYRSHQYDMLQPPGSPGWNILQWKKTTLMDDDCIFKTSVFELPAGFSIVEYKSDNWRVAIIGKLQACNDAWMVNVEHVVMPDKKNVNSGTWWTELFKTISNETQGELEGNPCNSYCGQQELVENLVCCSTNNQLGQYDAAVITTLCGLENEIGSVVSNQSSWCEFLIYAYDQYWTKLSDGQKEEFLKKKEFKPPSFSFASALKYGHGEIIWGYDEFSAGELRKTYKSHCLQHSDLAAGLSKSDSLLQNIVLKLKSFQKESGSFLDLVKLLASKYGLESTLEQMSRPSFDFFKKAIEMGMPVLTKCKNGKWVVVAGYKKLEGQEQLLVVDFNELKPVVALAEVSDERHRAIMALQDYAPGKQKYLSQLKSEETRLLDRQLSDAEDLPPGVSFVEFDAEQYAEAYVIHSWKRTIPGDVKRKIDELVQRSVNK